MRAIICEGPDGSGKTTLAKKLADHFAIEYRRPPQSVLSSLHGPVTAKGLADWWREQGLKDAVYDRTTFISAPIYGLVMPKRAQPDADFLSTGIFRLMNADVRVVFCLPPLEKQLESVRDQHRDNLSGLVEETYEKIDMAYRMAYTLWKEAHYVSTFRYDYTKTDWTDLAEQLEG